MTGNDPLFDTGVTTAHCDDVGKDIHWINGTIGLHTQIMREMAGKKTFQLACNKAVYHFCCDEGGDLLYGSKYTFKQFCEKINFTKARGMGLLIMGMKDKEDGEPSEFEDSVSKEAGNSKKTKAATTS